MTDADTADQYDTGVGPSTGAGDPSSAPQLHAFDLAHELEQARGGAGWQHGTHSARTLLKAADLRLVLIAMHEGDRIAEHRAPGPISIHTLSGHIRVTAANRTLDAPARHVLTIERDVTHAVDALADSAFLLTIAWPADAGARP